MKLKKGGIIKKNCSSSSSSSSNLNMSSSSSDSNSSNKSKNKRKRKSKSFSRSRNKSQKRLKKAYNNKPKKPSAKIKSSILISKTKKIDLNNLNNPLIAQDSQQNEIKYIIKKSNEQYTQPQSIPFLGQFNDNLNQNSNYQEEIPISQEGYKNKAITDNFKDIPPYLEELNDLSLFEKKEEVENNLETNKYSIENLLLMDQTNKKLQKKYISIAIQLLNSEKDLEKIVILKEKIKKSGIILDEDVYKQEIKEIKIMDSNQNRDYINYKEKFFETLKYILKEESNIIEAKNKLKIEKIYQFNQPAELGNNNYYFYELCKQLRNKMDEIFMRYNLYIEFIPFFLEFIKGKILII